MKYEEVEQIVKKQYENECFIYRHTSNLFKLLDKEKNPILNITLSQMNKLVKKNIITFKHSLENN